jgi:hypothetical protein
MYLINGRKLFFEMRDFLCDQEIIINLIHFIKESLSKEYQFYERIWKVNQLIIVPIYQRRWYNCANYSITLIFQAKCMNLF